MLRLEVTVGNASGSEIKVEDELRIGRAETGPGALANDPEISRQHARIWRGSEGSYSIEDLDSSNGTRVKGRRITGPEVLSAGDTIELGNTTLVARVSEAVPPLPRLALRVHVDFEAGEASLELDGESQTARLVNEGGRWRLEPDP